MRWAEGVSGADRDVVQRELFLRCQPENPESSRAIAATADEEVVRRLEAEARTDVCELRVWTPQNLEAIAKSPPIEDTSGFDRAAYTLPDDPRLGESFPGRSTAIHGSSGPALSLPRQRPP